MKGYSIGMMGGYSLVALIVVGALLREDWMLPLTVTMMVLANFMNHPHFISSYKIFFEGFGGVRRREFAPGYLLRWWFAALGVPLVLIVLLAVGVQKAMVGDVSVFALAVLLYLVTVGWHYVKQGFGIGSRLIIAALAQLQTLSAHGCVVLGEPEYYQRFGFKAEPSLVLADVPAEYFMALGFHDDVPSGNVIYHAAFDVTA